MHAPANERDDEIVADIIRRVKCPPKVAPLVGRIVRRLIGDLRTAPEPFSGNQRENVEFAEKVRNEITKLEDTLKSAPNPLLLSVLFEERFWWVWWGNQATPMQINANTKRYIVQERAHQSRFTEKLSRLRTQCNEIIRRKPGKHGNIKQQHADAAMASFTLLEEVAKRTDAKLQLGCGPTSKFVEVARLFLGAATGEYDADLVRACKALKAKLDAKT